MYTVLMYGLCMSIRSIVCMLMFIKLLFFLTRVHYAFIVDIMIHIILASIKVIKTCLTLKIDVIIIRQWLESWHWHSKISLRELAAHMILWGLLTHAMRISATACISRIAQQMEL